MCSLRPSHYLLWSWKPGIEGPSAELNSSNAQIGNLRNFRKFPISITSSRRRTLKSTLHPAIFWEMVKFVDLQDLGVLNFSLVLPREPTMGSLRPRLDFKGLGRLIITSLTPTVGGGAGSSGACGPPLAWHVLRPLPWPRRFLEKAIRGPEPGAQVFEPLHLTPDLRAPTGRPSTFSFVFLCLSVCMP